jgi:hypothetical protein
MSSGHNAGANAHNAGGQAGNAIKEGAAKIHVLLLHIPSYSFRS